MGRFGGLVMENVEGLVEGGGHGHHLLLHRTSRADTTSHGEGVGLVEGGAVLLLTASQWVGLVMENVEGLVEGCGHGHHPLLIRTRRAYPPSHGEGG